MPAIPIFIYLQLLDFLTTLVGFKLGASEASPFIVKLIQLTSSPALSVAASKVVGLGLGGLCVALNRSRLIGWINYWYAGVIICKICLLSSSPRVLHH